MQVILAAEDETGLGAAGDEEYSKTGSTLSKHLKIIQASGHPAEAEAVAEAGAEAYPKTALLNVSY